MSNHAMYGQQQQQQQHFRSRETGDVRCDVMCDVDQVVCLRTEAALLVAACSVCRNHQLMMRDETCLQLTAHVIL